MLCLGVVVVGGGMKDRRSETTRPISEKRIVIESSVQTLYAEYIGRACLMANSAGHTIDIVTLVWFRVLL